ncbi:DNA gyrase inhibitor YacG [Pelagibacterium montanilacus]|uniref:DNA gyrase inhibitor YacG n=1 Tax=Pelagibacterium montanilacus TaxID=2185280 RepID=UPI000F8DA591|nr:DNA gyrase inhibitor YacG [Pelagibacterium montanilacus]
MSDASAKVTRLRTPKPCPICKRTSVQAFHPFCSSRCADIDLGRWLKGNYAIPGRDGDAGAELGPDTPDED